MNENEAVPPFSLVKPYDTMALRLFPYSEIAAYLHSHIQSLCPQAQTLFDIACGSGNLSLPLAQLGYQVTGLDQADAMLAAARKKATAAGQTIEFIRHDIQHLFPVNNAAAITCFYGGLNFLRSAEAVQQAIQAVYQALLPGGLFLFDQFSEDRMRIIFSGLKAADFDDFYVITQSNCNQAGYISHQVTYFLQEADGRYRRQEELQLMRIHPFTQLQQWLITAGFKLLTIEPFSSQISVPALQDDFLFVGQKT